ncbi:hypothetical protein KL925_001530 [Ogataea polymorpha]|nr:hypothetical protein KL925_001530 [Ogataea polymorpha]
MKGSRSIKTQVSGVCAAMSSKKDILSSPKVLSDINPIIFRGRNHIACVRCKNQKIKCSGAKPTCDNCKLTGNECVYPFKDRKIIILESQLQLLQARIKELEDYINGETGDNGKASSQTDHRAFLPLQFHTNNERLDNVINVSFGDSEQQERSVQPPHPSSINYHVSDLYFAATDDCVLSLPAREYAEPLVSLCLAHFRDSHYLYEETEFVAEFNRVYDTGVCCSPQLLSKIFITLAIGEQILYSIKSHQLSLAELDRELSSKQHFVNKTPGLKYFLAGARIFPVHVEMPTLSAIQTALLIGYYLQSLNRITGSYVWFGVATRWALSLNLHLRQPYLTPQEISRRKRVWWTVFTLDSLATSRIRLPQSVKFNETQIDLISEHDCAEWGGARFLYLQVSLIKFTDDILNSVYNMTSRSVYTGEKTGLGTDLVANTVKMVRVLEDNFEKDVARDFEQLRKEMYDNKLCELHQPLIHVYLKSNQYFITACRPLALAVFKKFIATDDARIAQVLRKCINAAKETISVLRHLKLLKLLITFDYWHTHFLFNSILILLITLNLENNHTALTRGIDLLKFMALAGNHVSKDSLNKLIQLVRIFNDLGFNLDFDLTLPKFDTSYVPQTVDSPEDSVDIQLIHPDTNPLDQNIQDQIDQTNFQLQQQQQQLHHHTEQLPFMFPNPEDFAGKQPSNSYLHDELFNSNSSFFDNLLNNMQTWDLVPSLTGPDNRTEANPSLQDPMFSAPPFAPPTQARAERYPLKSRPLT